MFDQIISIVAAKILARKYIPRTLCLARQLFLSEVLWHKVKEQQLRSGSQVKLSGNKSNKEWGAVQTETTNGRWDRNRRFHQRYHRRLRK